MRTNKKQNILKKTTCAQQKIWVFLLTVEQLCDKTEVSKFLLVQLKQRIKTIKYQE